MKRSFILAAAVAAIFVSSPVNASGSNEREYRDRGTRNTQTQSNRNRQQQGQNQRQGQTQTSNSNSNANLNNQNNFNEVYRERLTVASAMPANLTAGMDTCLGSASAGVQTQIVGVSGGKTTIDENCVMIKQVHLLIELGYPDAACYRARQNRDIDLALTAAGIECREPLPAKTEDVPIPYDRAKEYK